MEIWGSPVDTQPFWVFDPLGFDPLHTRPFKREREPWVGDAERRRATKCRRLETHNLSMEFDLAYDTYFVDNVGEASQLPMELLLDPLVPCSDSLKSALTAESQFRDHLNQIACAFLMPSCSMTDRLSDITCLLRDFNQIYHPQNKLLRDLDECAHAYDITVVTELLHQLRDDDSQIQFKIEGFCFLGLLARNDKARELITTNAFLHLVVSLLTRTIHTDLLEKCCFVLGNSISSFVEKDEHFQEFVEESELPGILLKRISQNPGNSTLQVCFFALGNLVFAGDFENSILNASGIDIAFKALEDHIEDDHLLVDIIFFLKNMACGGKGSNAIVSHPALLIIPTLMQKFSMNSQLCQLCVQLIFDLSFSGSVRFESLAAASAGLILGFLKTNLCDKLSKESIRTLSKIYMTTSPEGKISLLKEGLVEVVKCHLGLTNRRLVRQLLNQLSSHPLEHRRLPVQELPSLMELTARKLMGIGTPVQLDQICPDLKDFLSKGKQCSHCHNHYFDHSYERLDYASIDSFSKRVPKINMFCSRRCFDETASLEEQIDFN